MKIKLLFTSFALALPSVAQLSVPVLGYFPDGGRVRPAYGIPAASTVARAMEAGGEYANIAAALNGHLLVVTLDSGEVAVLRPGQTPVAVAGAGLRPDSLLLSPRGTAAALVFSASRRIQILKGLPDAPEVREIDVAFLGEEAEALAVSDDGEWLVGAWADGLHAFGPHGEANWLPVEGARRRLAFLHGSHDLAVATPTGLYRIIDIGGRAEVRLVLAAGETPLEPLALGIAANNRRAVVAEAHGRIVTVELETGVGSAVECACEPEGLFGLSRSVFRLTGLRDKGFKLFDADTGELLVAPLTAEEVEQ